MQNCVNDGVPPDLCRACIEEMAHGNRDVDSPACVRSRQAAVKAHPERALMLECMGLKAYPDPQPPGHPASLAECNRHAREGRLGLPVVGMSKEQIDQYHKTWGNR